MMKCKDVSPRDPGGEWESRWQVQEGRVARSNTVKVSQDSNSQSVRAGGATAELSKVETDSLCLVLVVSVESVAPVLSQENRQISDWLYSLGIF